MKCGNAESTLSKSMAGFAAGWNTFANSSSSIPTRSSLRRSGFGRRPAKGGAAPEPFALEPVAPPRV